MAIGRYDPERNDFSVFLWQGAELALVGPILGQGVSDCSSPRLGVRFVLTAETLQVSDPDGQPFLTSVERQREVRRVRQQAQLERERADRLAEQRRALGIDPDLA